MGAIRGSWGFTAGLLSAGIISALPLAAQETGYLAGLVVDDADGSAIQGATVSLPELGMVASTDGTGRFEVEGVPVGEVTVRFDAPGYVSVTEELALSAVEFFQVRLVAVSAALDEILVIAARGSQADRASRVDVREDEPSSTSVLELLADQIPGLRVERGGGNVGGGGAAVTIRGVSTFRGSTAPDVYLDGIRLDAGNTGEYAMHVLDAIPATEVARIRVLKGAAATGPYGFSANGAIIIETRHGGLRPSSSGR